MNDSLLFAGRDQRKAGLPAEMVEELNAMGQAVKDPAFAEAKIDEALTVRWLSARTGRGAREIQAMLPSVVANYFGAEMTPSQAYDRIVATEAAAKQGMELQVAEVPLTEAEKQPVAKRKQAERDKVKYQGWQTPRALGSGFQEFALNIPQGLFSAAAGALGERMPELIDPMADEETYRLARGAFNADRAREQQRRISGFDPGLDESGQAAVDAYGQALAKINDANKARLDEWRKTEGDKTLRSVATFWKELADATDERWGVDPAFAASGYGQFVKGVGSMPATSALMATGVVGLLGVGGATYAGVESARMNYEGDAYDPAAAVWSNLVNAGGQTLLEKVIKLDGVLERALGNTAKAGGRIRLPDYLRSVARTALGEGLEEVAQGQWDDVVAVAAYDEQRGAIPFIDEGVAKRRFWEFMAGAGGGAIMGSTFGGALAFDQNRAARKAGEYLTNRMGGLLNEFDAKQARRAFTDEEIRKMKDGETLLRAVNGDAKALSAYNKGVAAAKFINLKGASYGGVTLGEVDGRPAIMKDDGSVLVVDVSSPEAAKAWEDRVAVVVKMAAIAEDERVTREAAVSSLIDYITARHAERDQSGELTIERGKGASLVKQVGSLEEAERIYASYVASGALPAGLDVRTLTISGSSQTRWNEGAKRWETAIKIADGAQPTVVIEESVEDFVKRQLATEELTPDRINSWRAEVEGAADVLDERGAIEWVSKYAVAYATGKAQEGDVRLPSAFRVFLERFAKFVKEALELGKKLLDMERAGEIPPEFLRLLQESTGTVAEKERGAVNEVPMASEVDAEMLADAMKQDDFPKIEKTEAGGFLVTAPDGQVLATAETVEDAQDRAMDWYFTQEQNAERAAAKEDGGEVAGDELMRVVRRLGGLLAASKEGTLRGELKAIAENMTTADRLRMFRKDAMDLDQLREALGAEGFDFETPAEMIDAIERSTRGEPQYPKGAGGQTFSLGRAVPADASNVVEMPDGARLVGPTTFSIEDYRGEHKAPVAEEGSSLDNLVNIYPDDIYSSNAARFYGHFGDARDNEAVRIIQSMKGRPNATLTIYRAVPKQSGDAKAKLKELTNVLGYRAKFGFFPMGNKVVAALEEKYATEANYDKKQGLVVEDLNAQVGELEAAIKGAGKLTINPGDWVTTTRAYAVDHGESALNGSYDILKKTVKAKEIFTNGDSVHEWGYSPEGSKTTFSITAFHGTPHKVDKFSMSKIGTGEGAQAYGWGLYFAQNEVVAKRYQEQLRPMTEVRDLTVGGVALYRRGEPVDYSPYQFTKTPTKRDYARALIQEDLLIQEWALREAFDKGGVNAVVAMAREVINDRLESAREEHVEIVAPLEAILARLDSGAANEVVFKRGESRIYTVELLPNEEDFLDWDRPLMDQSENVMKALRETDWFQYAEDQLESRSGGNNPAGSNLYAWLTEENTDQEASEMLLAAGIPGIRYFDGMSRDENRGTRNFVIFDESLVKIIAENGKPVGGGAMGGQATFSLAQTETPAFKAWFKDSKVVDAQGKPLVVYHGTPDARFTEFRDGAHFTENPDYASLYTHPSASSINTREKRAEAAAVIPAYLSIKRPFDTRIPSVRRVFEREFLNKYGNGTPLTERGLPDWTDSRDLMDWIEETGQTFDGLILDEGGTPEGGWRELAYVPLKSNQIKSATGNRGTFETGNPDITMAMFSGDEAGGQMSPEMVELVKRGEELDEVLAKYGRLYTNEVGKAALVRMRDEGYLEAIDAGQAALRQSRKAGGQLSRLSLPADFRAGRIIPEVGQMLRARTIAAGVKATEDNEKVVGLYVKMKKVGMTTGDISDLDHALNNGHKDAADAYAKKFGILVELDAVRAVFEAQVAEALELGVAPGKFFNGELDEDTTKKLREAMKQAKTLPAGQAGRAMIAILEAAGMKRNVASYWPRKVLNREALLYSLGVDGIKDELDKLVDKAEAEAKKTGRALTEAEMDALVDMANANLQRKRFESGRKTPGSLKARVIETITKEQMVHYYKGIDAAMKHNTAMREYLETLRMFGASVVFEPTGVEFDVLPINVNLSAGAWVADYVLKGGISSEQRRELESIIIERFSYKATPSFYAGLRSFSYLQNLTQVTTFLTATIADTWTGFYASGGSPYRYGKNFVKAMQGLSKISALSVGLDPALIAAEYEALEGLDPTFKEAGRGLFKNILTEQGRAEWTPSQALQRLFGWFANKVGLRYFERVTREAHMNAAVDYLIDQAKAGTLPRKLQRNLVRYFGEEKAAQVVADMRAGKANDADVRFFAFNALADWKAISLDQMPESYLSSPKGRIFYMYKTWIAAQFAGIHHEAVQDIASGEPKRVISGVTTLVYLAALMMAVGLPVDAIVSWVQGRPFILSDSVINRILGAIGMGRYVASKITRGELKSAVIEFAAPPLGGAFGDVWDDAEALYYLKGDMDPWHFKTWRNWPGVGRVYNGYLGFKSEANAEARETAGGWVALTDGKEPKKTAEELEEMKRARLAKEYSID